MASSRITTGAFFQHGPGDSDTLPLSSGEMGASAAHPGVIAMLQLADETVASGGFGDLFHFLIRGIYPPIRIISRMVSSKR